MCAVGHCLPRVPYRGVPFGVEGWGLEGEMAVSYHKQKRIYVFFVTKQIYLVKYLDFKQPSRARVIDYSRGQGGRGMGWRRTLQSILDK